MKDFTGRELELGDYVAYPASVGNSMKSEMVVGRLVGTKLKKRTVYSRSTKKYGLEEVLRYQVAPITRSRSAASPYAPIVTIFNTENILKVEKPVNV